MTLHALTGHERLREAIGRAHRTQRLPPVLLLHGPRGVGKQRLALWLASLLLCEDSEGLEPCQSCRSCRLSVKLEHPDLHWYFPVEKPPTKGSPERDDLALEEARIAELAHRRSHPLRPSYSEEVRGLHFGTVRNLRREGAKGPGLGGRRAFIIGDAELLVAQESSPEAANALLKLLEEPPTGSSFLLTSSEPGRLLPTIRSRAVSLFVPPLPRGQAVAFLLQSGAYTEEAVAKAVELAGGSIGEALGYLPTEGTPKGPLEEIRQRAFHLLRAALDPSPTMRFRHPLELGPGGGRGLHPLLHALSGWIRDLAMVAHAEEAILLNQDAAEWLRKTLRARPLDPARVARSAALVERARLQASGNVNPQLLLSGLLIALHREFQSDPSPPATPSPR